MLGTLAKPIQDTLHLTDGQLGRIGGLSFAMVWCFVAIPVSWLADRTSRVGVLTVACAIWRAATIARGLARGYPAEDDAGLHACHASELPFVFGTADRTPPRCHDPGHRR